MALAYQTGLKLLLKICNTLEIEPNGQLAIQMVTAVKVTFAQTTCGNTTVNLNQQEDAGSLLSALILEPSGCSTEEKSNGGAIHTQPMLLMD